jgi:hypothetical protein
MRNMCPNPGCAAVYGLTPQHVGRQFACRKCGVMLAVDVDGLRLADGAPAAPAETSGDAELAAAASAASAAPRLRGRLDRAAVLDSVRADPFTFLFGAGTVLAILFVFFPLLDVMGQASRRAYVQMREQEMGRADSGGAREQRETWEQERRELTRQIQDKEISNQRALYWYTWGQLVGFLMLGVAALGFVARGPTAARRVTGSVVLCALVVLIFLFALGGSFAAAAGTMSRGALR